MKLAYTIFRRFLITMGIIFLIAIVLSFIFFVCKGFLEWSNPFTQYIDFLTSLFDKGRKVRGTILFITIIVGLSTTIFTIDEQVDEKYYDDW